MEYKNLSFEQKENFIVDVYGHDRGEMIESELDEYIEYHKDMENCLSFNS